MKYWARVFAGVLAVLLAGGFAAKLSAEDAGKVIRVGIIGTDTPHASEFARIMNDPKATGPLARCSVTAAYPGGSADVPKSVDLLKKHGELIRAMGVEMVGSIEELLPKVDAVMIETLDGRPHLAEAKKVIAARKRLFIDKPLAGSLADCVEIAELAKREGVPCFSSSSLRYSSGIARMGMGEDPAVGRVLGCVAYSPNKHLEPHRMPDLFYYGIHGAETLFTIMGPGCEKVTRVQGGDTDVVVSVWKDGRVGSYRSWGEFGALVFGTKGVGPSGGWDGYAPLVVKVAEFFASGKPPVTMDETLEIYAFLEAADCSKRRGGCPVDVGSVLEEARREVGKRMGGG